VSSHPCLYVGLDHSLTGFGVAAVPADWGLDWSRVRRVTLETPPGPDVQRRGLLVGYLVSWIEWLIRVERQPHRHIKVSLEGGIFMRGKAQSIRSQERLAAIVEHELYHRLSIQVGMVEQTAARTVFAGPSTGRGRGAGDAVQALLRELVGPSWDEAELDAFVVANAMLADAGEAFVSVAPAFEPKPKRRRKAA
jgi:hypothetical protein